MFSRLAFALFCLVWIAALPAQSATVRDPGKQLAEIAEHYFEAGLQLNPLFATYLLGEPRFEDRLAITIAPAERAKLVALQRRVLRGLRALPEDQLSDADRLTYIILRHQAQSRLENLEFPDHLLPIDHYGGLPVLLAQYGTGQAEQPLKTVRNYENFLKRLQRLPVWNDQAIANIRVGIQRGVVLPRPLIERSIETLKPLTEPVVENNPFNAAIQVMPAGFSAADRTRLAAAYRTAIRNQLVPSMQKLVTFLESEYLPRGTDAAGLGDLPDGARWYANRVKHYTSTDLSADAIHQLGLAEVARIRSEMEKIKVHYQFNGPLTEFLRTHSRRPEFRPFKTEQDVLDAYQALNQKIMAHLPSLFGRTPKAPLEIRAEPEISRATGSDRYLPPTADGSRPGVFFTVILDPAEYSTTGMTTLFLHEGQPGHHYQGGIQLELTLPRFRKYEWITAYGEGWALYAETLGHEMGLYADPNAYLGHLRDELLRAVRLVTDTGLHAKGWTREQSMQYMMETQGYSEREARRDTERYMADPGQALAYKIGALKIRELRDRAQARLGARFSMAAFHDQILGEGGLPLNLLEDRINRWIARTAS